MRMFMAGRILLDENAMVAGDLNGDGRVNAKDQLMLRRILAGVI